MGCMLSRFDTPNQKFMNFLLLLFNHFSALWGGCFVMRWKGHDQSRFWFIHWLCAFHLWTLRGYYQLRIIHIEIIWVTDQQYLLIRRWLMACSRILVGACFTQWVLFPPLLYRCCLLCYSLPSSSLVHFLLPESHFLVFLLYMVTTIYFFHLLWWNIEP